MSFFSTGAQPAEALPDSTLAYVSIDLDPSGGQKIEAVRTLNKFPEFKDQLGLETDDDVRRWVFDEIQGSDDACANLDYEDDLESWLGNRAAIAAVDTGADSPTVAAVVQVTDADAAESGLVKLQNCAAGGDAAAPASGDDTGGFAIAGDWAVIAETDELAERIVTDTEKATLADDADYQKWTEAAGDPGIVSIYASPEAPAAMSDGFLDPMTGMFLGAPVSSTFESTERNVGGEGEPGEMVNPDAVPVNPPMVDEALAEFGGMAATLRFDDGAIELESAGDFGQQAATLYGSDGGDDVMATLPGDTVAAFGMGFEEGWLTQLVERLAASAGEDLTADELLAEVSAETGLHLPNDVETLAGESAVVALGPGFDADQLMNSADGSDIPVGVKVKGDPAAIEKVLDKLRGQLGGEELAFMDTDADGDVIAIGPNADYRGELLADGGLGDSETFQDVIREAEQAGVVFYLDFDAGDDWLLELVGDDPDAAKNLAPLGAVGMSAWQEDGVSHGVVRVTTDD